MIRDLKSDGAVDDVLRSFMSSMRSVWGAIPDAVWLDSPDLVRYSTGSGAARANGIVVLGPNADEEAAAEWVDQLSVSGLTHCILSRESAPAWVPGLASWSRLGERVEEALMVHREPGQVAVPEHPLITRVDPHDAAEVALAQRLCAEGFGARIEDLGMLMTPEVLRCPGVSAYVGRLDGEPCTTGLSALRDGIVGVFNVATPPPARRQGPGEAVTARALADGVTAGAHTAYLQASTAGQALYERMGFRTVEVWPSYYPGV